MSDAVISIHAGDGVLFGSNIPQQVNRWLQEAARHPDDEQMAEQHLMRALQENSEQLETYVALYKLYCYLARFDEAEAMARIALQKSAEQAGIKHDWRKLDASSTDWSLFEGPARLLLYSLKALAFIRLRQGDIGEAELVLDQLQVLDPTDRVGASVVRDILRALNDDDD
ncbi:hypothetical protein [Mariprofundus ferrooxydans]|uniref:hypothetical protein n=1 Tax=Mariprofundus ferrooxydans TaxID=314344 RepID=UPI00036E997C|nr:hypothetical protein [Mariprofundus ferrooxydans]